MAATRNWFTTLLLGPLHQGVGTASVDTGWAGMASALPLLAAAARRSQQLIGPQTTGAKFFSLVLQTAPFTHGRPIAAFPQRRWSLAHRSLTVASSYQLLSKSLWRGAQP